MTYACLAWELAADIYLLKLQRLQNKVLGTIRNFPSCTPVSDLHTDFIHNKIVQATSKSYTKS
jgi:hypothetical protein